MDSILSKLSLTAGERSLFAILSKIQLAMGCRNHEAHLCLANGLSGLLYVSNLLAPDSSRQDQVRSQLGRTGARHLRLRRGDRAADCWTERPVAAALR